MRKRIKGRRVREVLKHLSDDQWLLLFEQLRLFIRKKYFGPLADEELIIRVYIDLMKGKRSWRVDQTPFQNFCSIIRSIASNDLKSHTKVFQLEAPPGSGEETFISKIAAPGPSPLRILEEKQSWTNLVTKLNKAVGHDEFLMRLVNYVAENPEAKPKTIANALGVAAPVIYSAQKRLERRTAKLTGIGLGLKDAN